MTTPEHLQTMRAALYEMRDAGMVRTIAEPVALRHELAACLSLLPPDQTVLFENVIGHPGMRIVANFMPSRGRIAAAIDCPVDALQARIVAAIDRPLTPLRIADLSYKGPSFADPDLAGLPIPTFFEHETGPYITAGAIVARDPETGRANLSIARLKPLGGNRAFIGIAPNHHLAALARRAAARGETLPIAVTIGNHPAVMLAAALYLGLGEDEMAVAGALLGTPIEVVHCPTVGLDVPIHSEIVLEGRLDPGQTIAEGPVSEFHGYYEDYGSGQIVTIERMTLRHDPIFQIVMPGYHAEHVWIGAVAIAAGLARSLRQSVPAVRDVAVTPGGAGRLHAVIGLADPEPGDAQRALYAAWTAVSLIKQITVVDADIDVWDPVQVEWAVATRMRAERDLLVMPGMKADRAEPLERTGTVAKLGIDATRKPGDRDWTPAAPPADVVAAMRKRLGL